jgi:hypothetical protein
VFPWKSVWISSLFIRTLRQRPNLRSNQRSRSPTPLPRSSIIDVWRQPSLKGRQQNGPTFSKCSSPQTPHASQPDTTWFAIVPYLSAVTWQEPVLSSRRGGFILSSSAILLSCSSYPNCEWDGTDGIVTLAIQRKWDRKASSGREETASLWSPTRWDWQNGGPE